MLHEGDVIQSKQLGKGKFLVERADADPPFKNEVASYNREAQRIIARRLGLDGKYDPRGTAITFHTTQGWTDYISSIKVTGHMSKHFTQAA